VLDLTVEVRDKTLTRLGQIRREDMVLSLTDKFNAVGEWQVTLPLSHPMADVLRTPGAGLIITRSSDGTVLASGPVESAEVSASSNDPAGSLVVKGITDDVILADRLAFPQPSNVDPTTQTEAYDKRTGAAETLMHAYVSANVGPAAPSARRDMRLTFGADGARGSTVTKNARFDVLGSLLTDLANGAGLGFRIVQSGAVLQFQTFAVVDRSAAIRLDVANNTLASQRVATAPPGATRVVVAGKGEAVDRAFADVSTAESLAAEAAWGRRIELFLDRRQNEDADLAQAGLERLAEQGFSAIAVQAVPAQDTSMEFGRDWNLGDLVTVVVEGVELKTTVTGYTVKADSEGVRQGVLLGDPEGFRNDGTGRVASIDRRVSSLEANAENGGPPTTVDLTGAAAGADLVTVRVTGDSQPRLTVDADGTLRWSTGAATPDTNLYRLAADTLATDDSIRLTDITKQVNVGGSGSTAPFAVEHTNAGNTILTGRVTGDTVNRFNLRAGGQLEWGPGGSTVTDTNLYRSAADHLKTDDMFSSFRVGCLIKRVAGLSVPSGGGATVVVWDTSITQTGGTFITVSGNTVTIPSGRDGLYAISLVVLMSAGGGARNFCDINVNTAAYGGTSFRASYNPTEGFVGNNCVVPLAGGDWITCDVYQTSGSTQVMSGYLFVYRISA
jgi:hypothetical protein